MEEIARLLAAYASAVDARDLDALRELFLAGATLTVRRGEGEAQVFRGRGELSGVIEALAPFELTLHEVSSVDLEVDPGGNEASARSVCVAHHVRRGAGREASDLVLHGRYTDRFRRGADGPWRFASRELLVLWTEKRAVRTA